MKKRYGRWRSAVWGLLAGAWLLGAGPARSQAVAASPPAALAAQARDNLLGWIERVFTINPQHALDAGLRAAAQAMAARHVAQMRELLPRWEAEALAAEGGAPVDAAQLGRRLYLRYLNEFALWRLDRLDDAQDERLFNALIATPAWCQPQQPSVSWFDDLVGRWQRMPSADRAAFVEAEGQLLARFAAPDRGPLPLLDSQSQRRLEQARERLRLGAPAPAGTPPALPMSPMLAHHALREAAGPLNEHVLRCALQHWWLRSEAAAAPTASRRALLDAFRWATAPRAGDFDEDLRARSTDEHGYPLSGRRYEVTGSMSVRLWVDAEGRTRDAQVLSQRLSAAGVPGRMVAFEAAFEQAARQRLFSMTMNKPDPARLKNGVEERVVELVWDLQ